MNGYAMIVLSMLIWGSIGVIVRRINQPPEVIVFFRVSVAFLSMVLMNSLRGKDIKQSARGREWSLLIIGGIFISLNWMFFFKAIKTTSVAAATLSYYTSPVILTVLSIFLLGERITLTTIISIALSFTGIAMMIYNGGSFGDNINSTGITYGVIAAVFYALVTISGKKLQNISSYGIVLVQTGVATIVFLPFLRYMNDFDITSMILLLVIGTIHTSLALTLYFEGIKKVKIQYVGTLSYIDPLSAVFFALIFLGEVPDMRTILGGLLILLSTYIVLRVDQKQNNS